MQSRHFNEFPSVRRAVTDFLHLQKRNGFFAFVVVLGVAMMSSVELKELFGEHDVDMRVGLPSSLEVHDHQDGGSELRSE